MSQSVERSFPPTAYKLPDIRSRLMRISEGVGICGYDIFKPLCGRVMALCLYA